MGYLKKRIFIIILLSISSLVGIIISDFNLEAYEIPSGYGKVKFGMLKEQVKQILSDEGTVITNETNTDITTTGELFGEKVTAVYLFTPITHRCTAVGIYFFPPTNIKALQERIRKVLIEKYGKPYPTYVDGQSLPLWDFGSIEMGLFGRTDRLFLFYAEKKLVDIGKEEQNKLDKEPKNKL